MHIGLVGMVIWVSSQLVSIRIWTCFNRDLAMCSKYALTLVVKINWLSMAGGGGA